MIEQYMTNPTITDSHIDKRKIATLVGGACLNGNIVPNLDHVIKGLERDRAYLDQAIVRLQTLRGSA
jgi:hypothetical protein